MHIRLRREFLGALIALTLLVGASPGDAHRFDLQPPPLLLIGASFLNGTTPFNDHLEAPIGGFAVNFGSYLSLGDALIALGQFVVNEAQAGPAGAFAQKHTVLHNVLSDNRLHDQKTASETTDCLA